MEAGVTAGGCGLSLGENEDVLKLDCCEGCVTPWIV